MGSPGRRIAQVRGRATYEALVTTAFRLLEQHEFDEITIADLAREAGYSVGAFYARFDSKDQLLEALVSRHLVARSSARDRILAGADVGSLPRDLIRDLVSYYWKRRRFWRAVLQRGMRDREFWAPLRNQATETIAALIARLEALAGRPIAEAEAANVRFAVRIALGMINDSIVIRPGQSLPEGKQRFIENVERAFRLVADYDGLVGH